MYRIKDLQFDDKYFGDFETIEEAIEQLISYHENDCDMRVEKKLLKQGKIQEAKKAIEAFEWEFIKI